jgi:hypothetical protein
MDLTMTPDAVLVLQNLMDYCHAKWEEANQAPPSDWLTPDVQTGRKMAYNDVLQHARTLLTEKEG